MKALTFWLTGEISAGSGAGGDTVVPMEVARGIMRWCTESERKGRMTLKNNLFFM